MVKGWRGFAGGVLAWINKWQDMLEALPGLLVDGLEALKGFFGSDMFFVLEERIEFLRDLLFRKLKNGIFGELECEVKLLGVEDEAEQGAEVSM